MNRMWEKIWVIGIVAIIVFMIIEGIVARKKGNRSLLDRMFGAVLFGGPPFSEKKDRPEEDHSFAEVLLAAAIGVAAFKAIEKTYSLLKGIDWKSLGENDKEALNRFSSDIERLRDNRDRLARAEQLAVDGDRISIEQGALLASATLEAGLKQLQRYYSVILTDEQSDGIVGLATALRDKAFISSEEYREARRFVSTVRNKVMHGEFHELDSSEVQKGIQFVRLFFSAHQLG